MKYIDGSIGVREEIVCPACREATLLRKLGS